MMKKRSSTILSLAIATLSSCVPMAAATSVPDSAGAASPAQTNLTYITLQTSVGNGTVEVTAEANTGESQSCSTSGSVCCFQNTNPKQDVKVTTSNSSETAVMEINGEGQITFLESVTFEPTGTKNFWVLWSYGGTWHIQDPSITVQTGTCTGDDDN